MRERAGQQELKENLSDKEALPPAPQPPPSLSLVESAVTDQDSLQVHTQVRVLQHTHQPVPFLGSLYTADAQNTYLLVFFLNRE